MESHANNSGIDNLDTFEIVTPTMVNDLLLLLKHNATESKTIAGQADGTRKFVFENRTKTELLKMIGVTYYPDSGSEQDMRVVWSVVVRDYASQVATSGNMAELSRYHIVEQDGRYATYKRTRDPARPSTKIWKQLDDNGLEMSQLARDLRIEVPTDQVPDTTS